jgi:hypothetical protein
MFIIIIYFIWAIIGGINLREIDLIGRQFTWANSLPRPTYEKACYRFLMMTEWKFKYPMVIVHALDRDVSDHTPLLLDTRTTAFMGTTKPFKMEIN